MMNNKAGFTIVELLVVLTVIALLLSIVTPRYLNKVNEGQEIVLRQNLATIRRQLDQYQVDKGHYPLQLNQLVEARYLRFIPLDPITQATDWQTVMIADAGGLVVYDVKSRSTATAGDGTRYADW